jgi:HrpA-like RNA helicase
MELDVGGKIIALPAEGFNFRTNDQLQLEISEWTQNEMFLELQRIIFLLEQAVQLVETQAKKRNASFRAEIDEQQVGKLHARLAQMQMDATVESTGLHIESVKRVIPEKMQWKADGLPVNKDGKWVDGGNRENLPIVQSIPELIDSLEKNQLVVLQAPTGTGKTTLATAAIRLAFKSKWDPVHDVRLHASQPSRSSTVWIGTEVAKQAKVRLGEEVACNLKARSTRSDEGLKAGPKTEQVIEVNQTMLNWILREVREFQKLPDGVIFLDEAHLGGKELFTAMTIIKYYLPFSPNTRVVVTSATLNKELYSDYYKDPDGMPEGGKIVEVEAHGGVVDVIPVVMTESEHHYQTAARQASTIMKQILNSRRYLEQGNGDILSGATHEEMKKRDPAEQLFSIVNPESAGQLLDQVPSVGPSQQELLTGVDRKVMDSGSIAVMVAGKEDVRSVINRLAEDARRNELITEQEFQAFLADNPKNRIINTDKIQILHIHGETDPKIRDLIKTPLNKQTSQIRFVIATGDIIRTSATVPELLGLVDTMEVKRPGINDQGATVFRKREITFAEVMQGVGRLSRIRTTIGGKEVPIPGNYYPVDFYDRREGSTYNRIRRENKFPKPEMCDCPLTLPTLWLAAAGISIKDCQFPLATGEEIPEKFKDEAISRLKKNGVLNANGTINEPG